MNDQSVVNAMLKAREIGVQMLASDCEQILVAAGMCSGNKPLSWINAKESGEYDTVYECPRCGNKKHVQDEDTITEMSCVCGFYGTLRQPENNQPKLKVVIRSFPESNGKRNWTAMLMRVEKFDKLRGNANGVTLARSELWNRVAFEAEYCKCLLGLRETEPDVCDYGDDIKTPEEWKGEVRLNERLKNAVD